MYIFYGYSGCPLQQFFISFILILCVIQSGLAVLPAIQNRLPHSGLLQSSVVSVYAVYLTWNAVATWPYNKCQPGYDPHSDAGDDKKWNAVVTAPIIVALIVWMLTLIYSCIRTVERSQVARATVPGVESDDGGGHSSNVALTASDPEAADVHRTWDDENDSVSYSYSLSHFMYMLAALYMMMTITQWYSPGATSADGNVYEGSTASTWVYFPVACVVCVVYIWTLVAPMVFPDREFS